MSTLPIFEVIDEIRSALASGDELVVEAAPGAGKTTQVPLALLKSSWLGSSQIVMLEPRRVAARAAAERMAQLLGEKVGETVGFRIRHENRTGLLTKIIVVTEGILTRWLQQDPALENVGLVIFDEFHERNLDADLGLALCLQARQLFREEQPLKLLVMSATLDGSAISKLLRDAPVVKSKGRSYPIELNYSDTDINRKNIIPAVTSVLGEALQSDSGNILVFLPGKSEIEKVRAALKGKTETSDIVLPLHGGLSLEDQQRAIAPLDESSRQLRKIVLATDIAETSLTIEGIKTVIDSGLARKPEYDPRTAMTRLATKKVSLSSATQRAGRAGRLGPGKAYRLWTKHDETQFKRYPEAEILNTDLCAFCLQYLQWGVHHPSELDLLDQPGKGAIEQAITLLKSLGAIDNKQGTVRLSEHGHAMASFPAHPRLAHMLIAGQSIGQLELAAKIAAVLQERAPIKTFSADLNESLALLSLPHSNEAMNPAIKNWQARVQKQANQYIKLGQKFTTKSNISLHEVDYAPFLLARAFPDRIARKSDKSTIYKLTNGRQCKLNSDDPLQNSEWLVIPELGGVSGSQIDHVYRAIEFSPHLFDEALVDLVETKTHISWNTASDRLEAERQCFIEKLCIRRSVSTQITPEERSQAVIEYLRESELKPLNWDRKSKTLCDRVSFIRTYINSDELAPWPDFSQQHLCSTIETWLAPFVISVNRLSDVKKLNIFEILLTRLDWSQQKKLDELAPEYIQVPSGSRIRVDYAYNPPVLAVKLQEMFGTNTNPSLMAGRVSLSLHLLSPAGRPLQITQDLENFWRNGYADVKKEMKGRYPKHPWPEKPEEAEATRFTKKRAASKKTTRGSSD